jgi:hypothetical protein
VVLIGLGAHGGAERLLEAEPRMASENGLDGGSGHLPLAHADDIEACTRLHEMSFDPVLGTHLWIEVLTDRVSEGRAAGLSPATLSTPAPGDGGRCGGETGWPTTVSR